MRGSPLPLRPYPVSFACRLTPLDSYRPTPPGACASPPWTICLSHAFFALIFYTVTYRIFPHCHGPRHSLTYRFPIFGRYILRYLVDLSPFSSLFFGPLFIHWSSLSLPHPTASLLGCNPPASRFVPHLSILPAIYPSLSFVIGSSFPRTSLVCSSQHSSFSFSLCITLCAIICYNNSTNQLNVLLTQARCLFILADVHRSSLRDTYLVWYPPWDRQRETALFWVRSGWFCLTFVVRCLQLQRCMAFVLFCFFGSVDMLSLSLSR